MTTKPTLAKCTNEDCNYEWFCKSKMLFVNCPSCRKKVKINRDSTGKRVKSFIGV